MTAYEMQLAAVSEGMCPEHQVTLGADGWCGRCGHCGAWWSIERHADGLHVVTRYPPMDRSMICQHCGGRIEWCSNPICPRITNHLVHGETGIGACPGNRTTALAAAPVARTLPARNDRETNGELT